MKKFLVRFLLCLLALIFALGTPISAENSINTVDEVKSLTDGIVAFKSEGKDVQAWINTSLSEDAGISAEWYVIALSLRGNYDFSQYKTALNAYLEENEVYSATTRQKYALALIASGQKDGYVAETADDSIGKLGIMSYVFGLHLLNNGVATANYTAESLKDTLLSLQLPDGGWALRGEKGDTDVTAMTLQSLAAFYKRDDNVKTAVNNGLNFLSAQQRDDGDYIAYGKPNPESTAQVLLSLCELGIDGLTDERFIKNGKTLLDGIKKFRLNNGSFCHEAGGKSNENATAQVFCALTAYTAFKNGVGSFYLFDNRNFENETPGNESFAPIESIEESETESVSAEASGQKSDSPEKIGYKVWAVAGIFTVACLACLVLFITKKRNRKNFIFVIIVALVLVAFVLATNFQTAEEYYNGEDASKSAVIGSVTLEIRCDTLVGEDNSYIPAHGTVLEKVTFEIEEGDTVYDILTEAARKYSIQMEITGGKELAYVAGINYIYELQYGDLSGWMYFVNGESPSVGCGEYTLSDGDEILWQYTTDMGEDIK